MKVFVAAWVGSANAGDELLFTALRQKLARRGAEVTVVSVDPRATRRAHGVEAVSSGNLPGIVGAIRRADALVLGGGGLLQDETSHLNLPYHLSRVWVARAVRTPFAGVGLGAGALGSSLGRWLVRHSLRRGRGFAVRDPESASLLSALGIPEVVTAADLAFSLAVPDLAPTDRVAVCLRPWPQDGRALPMSMRWRRDIDAGGHLTETFARGLDEAARATGLEVRFVAFHRGRDDLLHRRVAERMRSPVSFAEPEPAAVAEELGAARATITMRYHGAILAAMCGRPAVLVGGSAKLRSLAAELGPGAARLSRRPELLAALALTLERVLPAAAAVREAVGRLRHRERGNDAVLDRLLGGG
jgi:polysaccharide pyruvyl transferase CsaB